MPDRQKLCSDPELCLIIGDIKKAMPRSQADRISAATVCSSLFDAIGIAARTPFANIFVVVDGFNSQFTSALRALRDVNSNARLILLVQMYEEPFAIELSSKGLINDYFVCPVKPEQLFVQNGISENNEQSSTELIADAQTIEQLARLATEDELTGLKNRRYIREFLRQLIERAATENMRVTLLAFDLDDFKHYNDMYGHAAGDDILRQAAILIRRSCRKHDVVGRIGGDEFAVVFWDNPKDSGLDHERRSVQAAHPKEIIFLVDRFRREMHTTELAALGPEGKGVLTISGGIASFPRDGSSVQDLFEQADKGLLEAKRSGKNRIYLVGEPTS